MDRTSIDKGRDFSLIYTTVSGFALVTVFGVLTVGCSPEIPSAPVANDVQSVTTNAVVVEEQLTADGQKAVEMRGALDGGDIAKAVRLARSLQRSPEREVRMEVVEVYGWCGTKTLPELVEMTVDADSDVAQAAYTHWESSVSEISSERVRALRIEEAVTKLKDPEKVRAALILLAAMDDFVSLSSLERIIINNRGRLASTCAKEVFEHVAGEPWASEKRTKLLIKKGDEPK